MAAPQSLSATVRIECACRTCKANAAKIGAALPLAADVPAALAASLGGAPKGRHGLVHIAHDPNKVTGEAARKRLNVTAA